MNPFVTKTVSGNTQLHIPFDLILEMNATLFEMIQAAMNPWAISRCDIVGKYGVALGWEFESDIPQHQIVKAFTALSGMEVEEVH